jgi:hypothetical protein
MGHFVSSGFSVPGLSKSVGMKRGEQERVFCAFAESCTSETHAGSRPS